MNRKDVHGIKEYGRNLVFYVFHNNLRCLPLLVAASRDIFISPAFVTRVNDPRFGRANVICVTT
ncbi:Uncharacterized protein APZ42_032580 [Daphnia magna]|uniref:Uncharacterized protein n=1 Tax=Daphnia magna TaxID=35525 RepID=A0A164LP57_9CRUS|nr:Uncharacterized protein APZ42_032580 [Daphnia magna]